MKTTKSLFGILTITLALAVQVKAQTFLTNGLVAYYPFTGNANDASGNGYNGTVQGAILTVDRFGIANHAYWFNGTNSRIVIPEPLFGPTTPGCTFSAWITIESGPWTNNQQMILYKSTQNGEVDIEVEAGMARFKPKLTTSGIFPASAPMIFDKPTHLVGVYSQGQQVELYINGVLANTTSVPNENLYVNSSLALASAIGIYDYTPSPYLAFRGTIEDVRIYNRALSAQEVQQLYQSESPFPCIPHRAIATAQLVNGFVVGATITDGGCGYTNTPTVLIEGGGGTGATATAVVSNGVVVNIIITDAGFGYTSPPNIYIYPPFGFQIGLVKAVRPSFSDLFVGTNYQLQVSSDLKNWTNQDSAFTATNTSMVYPKYFDVDNWSQLFFRLQVAP